MDRMKPVDMHVHTSLSDGDFSPEDVVEKAIMNGVRVLGITDHDILEGIERAQVYARGKPIEIVPGIEFSCSQAGFREVHILGYFIDHHDAPLVRICRDVQKIRIQQKRLMIKKLNGLGYDITYEQVESSVEGSFGRPHIARFLIKKYPKEFSSVKNVFDKYLRTGQPAFVDRTIRQSIKDAIEAIKGASGFAVLAHPGVYKREDSLELVDLFCTEGGDGIEVYYPYNKIMPDTYTKKGSQEACTLFKDIATRKKLLFTGGSDYHGISRPTSIGEEGLSYEEFQKISDRRV